MLVSISYPILCVHNLNFEIQSHNLIWVDFVTKLRLNLYETASLTTGNEAQQKRWNF